MLDCVGSFVLPLKSSAILLGSVARHNSSIELHTHSSFIITLTPIE